MGVVGMVDIMGCQDEPLRSKTRMEEDSFSPPRRSRRFECTWTHFHCVFFLGVGGFLFFWIFILLRMYLPVESAILVWWKGVDSTKTEGDQGGGGDVTEQP